MNGSNRGTAQGGQAIVLFASMIVVMLTGIGVAIDAANGYYWSTSAERAASAAAMSAVLFVPNQFTPQQAIPVGSTNDATDRALGEAKRNRFDTADAAHQVQVVPALVTGKNDQLQVTVSRSVPTMFLSAFGISTYSVKRVAIAAYLPPITLGQAGNQVG